MFGLGGVFIEVLKDVTFRVPPFAADEASRMLGELAGAPSWTVPAVPRWPTVAQSST